MKKTTIIVATAVILGLLLIPALAQAQRPGKGNLQEMLKKADGNGDGQITLQELQTVLPKMNAERFKKLDRNNDGVISPADNPRRGNHSIPTKPQQGGRPEDLRQKLKDADTNGDMKISLEEAKAAFPKMNEKMFKKLDTNNDGFIGKDDRPGHDASGNVGGGMMGGMIEKLRAADTNNDQQLSYDELRAAFPEVTEEKFNLADEDGNGQLTREEFLKSMMKKLQASDTDGDGKLSMEEAKSAFPRMNDQIFGKLDRNGDGFLSPEDRN